MVDYWETDVRLNPRCSHGPTLLFSRKNTDRKFYACAAFRDQKQCAFFLWQDESTKKEMLVDDSLDKLLSKFRTHRKKVRRFFETDTKKSFCWTCEVLFSSGLSSKHVNHDVKEVVDDTTLRYPTLIMKPKQESKGESQFHFSESTIDTIYNFLEQLEISAVMSIGCPSIHEFILNKKSSQLKSLLLDIDYRFLQFYDSNQFQVFNMFNCHMFDSEGWNEVERLFNVGKTCVIIDPPFGGRIEPLAYTLNRLQIINKSITITDLTILLVSPYFMEPVVKQSLPSFSMLDYKVEYVNHRQFRKRTDNPANRGSAVRIFTNADASAIALPQEEGYKYCDLCERWVCNENRHCFQCEACTSKNGAPYRHCKRCRKCVKQTWKHCFDCGICKLPEHRCKKEGSKYKVEAGKIKKSKFFSYKCSKRKKSKK